MNRVRCWRSIWAIVLLAGFHSGLAAQTPPKAAANLITFEVPPSPARPEPLPIFTTGVSPSGHHLEVNSRFLSMDGKPWLPVMGEFHFSRYPAAEWENELLKMRAGGVQIVATYVFWIHHEEVEGKFDWTGQRDLRRFIELCGKRHLYAFVRIGPFAHGEVRNGGLPDWVVKAGPVRRNTPEYLSAVAGYYNQIGQQLRGLLWKDGGPVIGIQLENEYSLKGPDAGAAHISMLKKMAVAAGLVVPLYTVTGWDNPDYPANEVLPVSGVYPDAFWDSSLTDLPASYAYLFSFAEKPSKVSLDPLTGGAVPGAQANGTPQLLAEAGGGMQVAYHRRPVISAADVAAVAITHLGSGANLYGYYMFQGGANPIGTNSTLQESAATDGVYDLPVISYDFQAPLSQYGELRPSYRDLKSIHYFLNQFGDRLAPMKVYAPDRLPVGPNDTSTPRVALRSDGQHAFLFLNDYLRDYPLAALKNLQFRINVGGNQLTVPSEPIDIPSGSYFIWPIQFDVNGINLNFSTAQLLCTAGDAADSYFFFFAPSGVRAEFSFDAKTIRSISARTGETTKTNEHVDVLGLKPGTHSGIDLVNQTGNKIHIVLLSEDDARNIWRFSDPPSDILILSRAAVFFDNGIVHLRSAKPEDLGYGIFSEFTLNSRSASASLPQQSGQDLFDHHLPTLPAPTHIKVSSQLVREAASAQPVRRGKYNALAPTDDDFTRAAVWRISIPPHALDGLADLFLEVHYQGDVARLYDGAKLLDDNFFTGQPWRIGLRRFSVDSEPRTLDLKITPLRKDAPIFLQTPLWPALGSGGEICKIESISAVPLYEATARLSLPK